MRTPMWISASALLACSLIAVADELTISPLAPIEIPPTTTNAPNYHYILPGVASSGTNAIFFWEQTGGSPAGSKNSFAFAAETNFFLSQLGPDAQPLDNRGHFVFQMPHSQNHGARVAAMNSGYFAVFETAPDLLYLRTPTNLVTRFSFDGRKQFEPLVIGTNFSAYKIASNGRTLLYVQRDEFNLTNRLVDSLRYRLVGANGATINSGVIKSSPQPPSGGLLYFLPDFTFAVASDGNDYLLLWAPGTNAVRFNGDTGDYSTLITTDFAGYFSGIGYGKNGYLLVDGAGFIQVRDDGSKVARSPVISFADAATSSVFAEGEGWVVFRAVGTSVISFRVTPTDTGLTVERNPYPVIPIAPQDRVDQMFAPLGPGQYAVSRYSGLSLLDQQGLHAVQRPASFSRQESSAIVGGSFGYLAVWRESDSVDSLIRGLRVAPDGTPIDSHSFLIGHGIIDSPPNCVFDGNDYAIAWTAADSAQTYVARIAPSGQPDVRLYEISLPISAGASLVGLQGKLFAWQAGYISTNFDLHIWQIFADGKMSAEISAQGESLVTDGKDLYSIANLDSGDIALVRIDPRATQPQLSTNIIARGGGAQGVSLRNGFVVYWFDSSNRESYAYFADGKERLRSEALPSTYPLRSFAANDDRFLLVSPESYRNGRYSIQTFNLLSGEVASAKIDFGTVTPIQMANAGKDFLAVADSASAEMYYAGRFWITPANAPSFSSATPSETGLKASLTLNPDRRYRIESSVDLLNWNVVDVISGVTEHEIANSSAEKEFVRAVLVPE